MGAELEQAEGDIIDMKRCRGSTVFRILEIIHADETGD